jgi:hypothetical protein
MKPIHTIASRLALALLLALPSAACVPDNNSGGGSCGLDCPTACVDLEACCTTGLSTSAQTTCDQTVSTADSSSCSTLLDAYQSLGFCTAGCKAAGESCSNGATCCSSLTCSLLDDLCVATVVHLDSGFHEDGPVVIVSFDGDNEDGWTEGGDSSLNEGGYHDSGYYLDEGGGDEGGYRDGS